LFFLTRFSAAWRFRRSHAFSIKPLAPERPFPCAAVGASSLRFPVGASPPIRQRQLQLPGLLRLFASEAHVRFALLSVRSFALSGYYDLG